MKFKRILHSPDRFLFLSDGIFAIAMTLMAIDITLDPNLRPSELNKELIESAHRIYVYFLSFYILARYWMGHLDRFERIKAMDRPLISLSLASLAIIALVPPTTAMISDYPNQPQIVSIYFGCLAILGLVDFVAFRYALSHEDIMRESFTRRTAAFWLRFRLGMSIIAIVCLVLAQWMPVLSLYVFFLLILCLDAMLRRPHGQFLATDTD